MEPAVKKQLLEIFKVELQDHYQSIVDGLLRLEENLDADALEATLQSLFRAAHNIKGAAKSVSHDEIASISHSLEDTFSVWRDQKIRPSRSDIDVILKASDSMLESINSETVDRTLKISSSKVDRVNSKADEALILQLKLANIKKRLDRQFKSSENDPKELLRLVGSLSDQLYAYDKIFVKTLTDLQSDLRDMRLLPVDTLLNNLKRDTHDLSKKLNKQVSVDIKGGEIEIDKSVLDLLRDPLQHLLRNSIDHGIQKKGHINIHVSNQSGSICLIFEDDGSGIDLEAVRAKVLSSGLVDENGLNEMTPEEMIDFIFYPGISTQKEVTEISGRGVGLDVVRNNIESSGGSIKVSSSNDGTKFIITVPLTLAVEKGLFISVSKNEFVIPSLACSSILEVKPQHLKRVGGDLVFVEQKEPISVFSLARILNYKESKNLTQGIVINRNQKKIMILVDEVLREHDYIVKSLPYPFKTGSCISGSTLTAEGKLILVIDPLFLFDEAIKIGRASTFDVKASKNNKRYTILVVDDSLTTRNLVVNGLTSAGFSAQGVSDGEQALHLFRENKYDLVVTDLEMPNMDGYELIKNLRKVEALKQIPIIVVTSNESEESRMKALACGANHFLVKSVFNTSLLINAIESIL